MVGLNISELLLREDKDVFSVATQEMLADESKTVEVVFHVVANGDIKVPFEMEGKGMLMYNRVTGEPSHTMWVIKSLGSRRWSLLESNMISADIAAVAQKQSKPDALDDFNESIDMQEANDSSKLIHSDAATTFDSTVLPISPALKNIKSMAMRRAVSHGGLPFSGGVSDTQHLLNIPPALCNICEKWVVAIFFEQHSELCVEIHRAEMDVSTCNDSLTELKHYVQGLHELSKAELQELENNPHKIQESTIDEEDEEEETASISGTGNDSIFGDSLPLDEDKVSPLERKRVEAENYMSLLDIMDVALSIPTPGLDECDTEQQTQLSSRLQQSALSKSKIIQILYWRPPLADDPDIESLIQDIEMITKSKVEAVNRMQDCLDYNERTRNEFQENVMHTNNWSEFVVKNDEKVQENRKKEQPPTTETKLQEQEAPSSIKTAGSSTSSVKQAVPSVKSIQQPPVSQQVPILKDVMEEGKGHQNIKKTIFKKIKDWKSKGKRNSSKSSKRSSKQQKKNAAAIPPPVTTTAVPKNGTTAASSTIAHAPTSKILEMETIETPLHSPKFPPTTIVPPPRKSSLPNQQRMQSSGSSTPSSLGKSPLSPLPAPITSTRPVAPSIKDFDIIKPISKGAFGSVFLAKKRVTGDYYAIKFLKKSDMIAKNQVTNVKAERMILMAQTDSPYVTKLYYTFQSKDYLYLVMEYLNGGDCSSLIKVLGNLPCDWARNYLAEVTLGLSYLHDKQIIHR